MSSNESLVRAQLEESLDSPLREFLRDAETVMLLIDTSGSMHEYIAPPETKKRIDALREVVASIKSQGAVPTIAFGGPYDAQVRFVDQVPVPDGGTPLHKAIPFAKEYGATRLVVVSDGLPDLTEQSLEEAKLFGGRIDVVFVGDVNTSGPVFLKELARLTGGEQSNGDLRDPKRLSKGIVGLLEGDVENKAPIRGEGFVGVEEPVESENNDGR